MSLNDYSPVRVEIIPVTAADRSLLIGLAVREDQRGFIESVEECLKEADVIDYWRPLGIWWENKPVGFAMYGFWPGEGEKGRLWLDRLMVDRRYQGKGIGRQALNALLAKFKETGREEIFLSVYADNPAAAMYRAFGFKENGERDINGEIVMVKRF